MRDILSTLEQWIAANETIALATVIQTWGSSPRKVGAKMGITASGKICGSVRRLCGGRGCRCGAKSVEDSCATTASLRGRRRNGMGSWLELCGGSLDVFVQPLDVKNICRDSPTTQRRKKFCGGDDDKGGRDWEGGCSWRLEIRDWRLEVRGSGESAAAVGDGGGVCISPSRWHQWRRRSTIEPS